MLKQRTDTFKHIVAGHGEIYSATDRAHQAIDYMVQRLESILDTVHTALADGTTPSGAHIVSAVAQAQGASITRCHSMSCIKQLYNQHSAPFIHEVRFTRSSRRTTCCGA